MERLKRERRVARAAFTKNLTFLESELEVEVPSAKGIQVAYNFARNKAEDLFAIQARLREELLALPDAEDECIKDEEAADEYRFRWEKIKVDAVDILNKLLSTKIHRGEKSASVSDESVNTVRTHSHCSKVTQSEASVSRKSHIRLPKLELRKYNGDLKGWIAFWGHFKQIDGDVSIDDNDKFQYLIQATEERSPARRLVESFPPSAANYKKAIASLQERFAREDMLIETYVRELLHLVSNRNKNKVKLSELYDEIMTQIKALETLGVTSQKYAAMLFPLVESAIPEDILKAWERTQAGESTDNLDSLLKFLKREVRIEERLKITRQGVAIEEQPSRQPTAACLTSAAAEPAKSVKHACIWCDKTTHLSTECYKAINMTVEQRKKLLDQKKGCQICLKTGHNEKKCFLRNRIKCVAYRQRHQTLLCPNVKTDTSTVATVPDQKGKGNGETSCSSTNAVQSNSSVVPTVTLLQTLVVKIRNGSDKEMVVRAFIDSGAQRSYILSQVAVKLNLKPVGKQELSHCLFGGVETKREEHDVHEVFVESLETGFTIKMTALQKDVITGYIPRLSCSHQLMSQLKEHSIELSDCGSDAPEIALLIGADYLGTIMTENIVHLDNNVVALKTKLGWTIQGPVMNTCYVSTNVIQANLSISELWDLETLGIKDRAKTITQAENAANVMENFKATVTLNEEGRYEVKLPWKLNDTVLLDNRDLAEARLQSTTKRLVKLNEVEAYSKVFQEWLDLNIIEKTSDTRGQGHYLSHHAVIKESSLTTRVRPVFNASAKDKNGVALNDLLDKGVNYLELIPKLLLKFRKHANGVISDIKKAFLQVSLQPDERKYLKFLWWEDDKMEKVIVYRHRRVVFGLTCSPFLLAATIIHHLEKYDKHYKETAKRLLDSFYVDNCVTSLETEEETRVFIEDAKEVMLQGKFELRGWVTAPMRCEGMSDDGEKLSVLGMIWCTHDDTLQCRINSTETTDNPTQRQLMSVAQKIFDPIGMTCPTTLIPKLLLQSSHKAHCKIDAPLPSEITEVYKKWLSEIQELEGCKIPRRLTKTGIAESSNSLHVFCDASKSAYATCIFLRSVLNGEVSVEMVMAKSRVAPLEEITIPRLELLAALIGSRLFLQVKETLELECETFFWTDSSVVLTWITTKGDWGVWVKNRVKEIRELTKMEEWHHLPGILNPADLPSRGCYPAALKESRWWEGPEWLRSNREEWPRSQPILDHEVDEQDAKKVKIAMLDNVVKEQSILKSLQYFSKYPKIVRTVAWILRFSHNCRRNMRRGGELSFEEYDKAEKTLMKLVQTEKVDLKNLTLQSFTDEDGLLKVRTKLSLSEDTPGFKSPILLPGKQFVVQRLVEHTHRLLKHAGPGIMIAQLRESYWIVTVRSLVKKTIRKCMVCKRDKAKPIELPMTAPLPSNRSKSKNTFEVTGIDLAGPLFLRSGEKVWFVIFTCAVYRAVHLELTNSLSTEAFLMPLRRFIARRGRPQVIYTDNGTNFHGAENLLKEIDWPSVTTLSHIQKIKWIFNPPAAPWWGGFWERLIRSIKDLLRRNLGNSVLDYEELYTLLCDCESLMNSRPLTYVSDDVLRPLTPACFLQSLPGSSVEDLDIIDHESLNIRIKFVQQLRQNLRQRFRSEYLGLLVQKGRESGEEPRVGEVVLVETPEKRLHWPLGIIQELFKGRDGVTRVAKVKTKKGTIERPLQRLYRLELTPENVIEPRPVQQNDDPSSVVTRSGRRVLPPLRFRERVTNSIV